MATIITFVIYMLSILELILGYFPFTTKITLITFVTFNILLNNFIFFNRTLLVIFTALHTGNVRF